MKTTLQLTLVLTLYLVGGSGYNNLALGNGIPINNCDPFFDIIEWVIKQPEAPKGKMIVKQHAAFQIKYMKSETHRKWCQIKYTGVHGEENQKYITVLMVPAQNTCGSITNYDVSGGMGVKNTYDKVLKALLRMEGNQGRKYPHTSVVDADFVVSYDYSNVPTRKIGKPKQGQQNNQTQQNNQKQQNNQIQDSTTNELWSFIEREMDPQRKDIRYKKTAFLEVKGEYFRIRFSQGGKVRINYYKCYKNNIVVYHKGSYSKDPSSYLASFLRKIAVERKVKVPKYSIQKGKFPVK